MRALLAFASLRRFARSRDSDVPDHADVGVEPTREGMDLRIKLLGAVVAFVAMSVAARIVGMVISRRLTLGDETSDEFRTASIMGGGEFHSHAEHLKMGTAITSLGGMELDLRDATLDPAGASLELRTTMGGIEVRVPEYWSVEVDQETLGGEFVVDVPAPAELPEDAPKLHIHAVTRMGGGQVTTKAA